MASGIPTSGAFPAWLMPLNQRLHNYFIEVDSVLDYLNQAGGIENADMSQLHFDEILLLKP